MKKTFLSLLILFNFIFFSSLYSQKAYNIELRTRESLNQWWRFYPVLTEEGKQHIEPGIIPSPDQFRDTILVPGSWTAGGSEESDVQNSGTPWKEWRINDSYGYPLIWDKTNSAWYFREFLINDKEVNRRYFIYFGGILREGYIFVNGRLAGHSTNGIMPNEWDITNAVRQGKNSLHVFVTDSELLTSRNLN